MSIYTQIYSTIHLKKNKKLSNKYLIIIKKEYNAKSQKIRIWKNYTYIYLFIRLSSLFQANLNRIHAHQKNSKAKINKFEIPNNMINIVNFRKS